MLAHRISDNLTLRLLQAHHAKILFDLVDSNRDHLRTWLPWLDKTLSEKDSAVFISGMLSTFASTGAFVCGIWHRERLCGVVGYNRIDSENKIGYIGYWLSKDAEGKGIMTDCCRAVIKLGFEEYGINRIVITVATNNIKSQAIPDRLGFSKEGVLHDAEWLYDHYVDHTVNALLAKKWAERADGANPRPFGTSVMLPADPAARAGSTPEASGDSSSGTFANYMKIEAIHDFHSKDYVTQWADRFQVTPVRQKLFDHMSDILQGSIAEKATVLELGIGPGYLARHLLNRFPEINYVGLDFSSGMLEISKENLANYSSRLSFIQTDLTKDDWIDQLMDKFEAIVSTWALHDLGSEDKISRVYKNSFSVLKVGGLIVNGDFIKPKELDIPYEAGRLLIDQHIKLLSEHGFKDAVCTQIFDLNLEEPTTANNYACIKGTKVEPIAAANPHRGSSSDS
jgi:ribosomal-protein-serine acetyltransferase